MQIACPHCAAVYEVPAARLTPGRSVRCARCNTVWKPEPPAEPTPLPDVPALPEPETAAPVVDAMQRLATMPPPPSPRRAGLIMAWLASIILLTGAGVGIVIWREPIMRLWPPSARVLALLDPLPQQPAQMPGNKTQ